MNKQTLEYIRARANKSEDASIVAVSCPDIRALLDERAALLEALAALDDLTNIPQIKKAANAAGYMAQFSTAKHATQVARRKAEG